MAIATMNISLPERLREFVDELVNEGGYGSASEYFRELVRGDQKRREEEKLENHLLRRITSGKSVPLTKKDMEGVRQRLHARLAAERKG